MHLLPTTSAYLQLGKCLLSHDPRLAKIQLKGELPSLMVNDDSSNRVVLWLFITAHADGFPVNSRPYACIYMRIPLIPGFC